MRPNPGHLSSALAALLLALSLGVGIADAWHMDEHGEDGDCTECVRCHVTTQGPAPEPTGVVDLAPADRVTRAVDVPQVAQQVATEHQSCAPRAPPA